MVVRAWCIGLASSLDNPIGNRSIPATLPDREKARPALRRVFSLLHFLSLASYRLKSAQQAPYSPIGTGPARLLSRTTALLARLLSKVSASISNHETPDQVDT